MKNVLSNKNPAGYIMIKTLTVREILHKEIGPGKGSMSWLLEDESGLSRTVRAIIDVAHNGKIEKIRPMYWSDAPLVECLHLIEEGQSFTLDFSGAKPQQNTVPHEVYRNMTVIQQLAGLGSRFTRLLIVLVLVMGLWLAQGVASEVMQMQLNMARVSPTDSQTESPSQL